MITMKKCGSYLQLKADFISSPITVYLEFSHFTLLNVPCQTFKFSTRFGSLKVWIFESMDIRKFETLNKVSNN